MSIAGGPFLVVGLGNPGSKYERNRHNVGFMVADLLAERVGGSWKSAARVKAAVAQGRLPLSSGAPGGPGVVLAKPLTFMNLSGGPVSGLANFFKFEVGQVIVVHDEMDLPFGTVRLKKGGGEGGHNGLRSMSQSLGSKDYLRVRFGIGRPPGRMDAADYVLRDFSSVERPELPVLLERAADALTDTLLEGLEAAQNRWHVAPA